MYIIPVCVWANYIVLSFIYKLFLGGLDKENIKSPLVSTIGGTIGSSPIQLSSVTIPESNDQSVPDPITEAPPYQSLL